MKTPLEIILEKEPHIQLTVGKDGVIYTYHTGGHGNKMVEYPPIEFIEKVGYDDEGDEITYKFRLNSFTCPVWRNLLEQNFGEDYKKVHVHGDGLDINSTPEEIKADFEAIRVAMNKANQQYVAGRPEVLEYAAKQDEERKHKSDEKLRAEEARRQKIQDSYADLDL